MAIARVGTPVSNNARATSTSVSYTVQSASNTLICAFAVSTGGGTISAPTGSGGTWTQVGTTFSNGGTEISIWYSQNSTAGTHTISQSTTATGRDVEMCVAEFSGIDTVTPLDGTVVTSTAESTSYTTTLAGSMIVAAISANNNAAFTVGTNFTLDTNVSGTANADQGALGLEHDITSTAGTVTTAFTGGQGTFAMQVTAFRAAGAGGGSSSGGFLTLMGCGI